MAMNPSALTTGSKRAGRALRRAGTDRTAQIVAGAATAAAGAVAAGRALAARSGPDDEGGPSRAYELKANEKPAWGLRRIAAGRADEALDHLRGRSDAADEADAVHEARKDLKKLRSVLRLVRPSLGDELYRRENERFRDAGRALGGARDAHVKLETIAALRERYDDEFPADGLDPLMDALAEERDALQGELADGEPRAEAAARIGPGRAGIEGWPLADEGWSLVGPGLERGYRRGRNRFADVKADPTPANVHEWRKRAKDLWYQLRIVRGAWPDVLGETADETHELADLLGDHHDLTVLEEDVTARSGLVASSDRKALRDLIGRRQRELLEPALELGERIYAEKPKAFAGRIGAYWDTWRAT
jgi:CHAD domain-containing protein